MHQKIKMQRDFIENEVLFRECPNNQVSPSQSSKLHLCTFYWSDKCFHCETSYDELNKKLSFLTEPNEGTLNELREQIEESLTTLQGYYC